MNKFEEIEAITRTSEKAMLHDKNLDATHMHALCPVLLSQDCPVRELNLYLNMIGPEGARELGKVLRKDTKISVLNLKCCGMKRDGTMEIFHALKTNHTLEVLNLEGNRSEAGVCEVALSLLSRPQPRVDMAPASALRNLSLAFNSLGPEGGALLASLLRRGCLLEELDVEGNSIGGECVTLVQALDDNSHLKLLNISYNNISNEQSTVLIQTVSDLAKKQIAKQTKCVLSSLLLAGNDLRCLHLRALLRVVTSPEAVLRFVDVRHSNDEEGVTQLLIEFALVEVLPVVVLAQMVSAYVLG